MTRPRLPPALREASSTAAATYLLLERCDGALPLAAVADALGVSERAVRAALADLRAADLVAARPDPVRPNRHLYHLAADPTAGDSTGGDAAEDTADDSAAGADHAETVALELGEVADGETPHRETGDDPDGDHRRARAGGRRRLR